MEVSEFFLKLLLIIISAKFLAEVFAYLKIPSVLGEVVAGIIIGPSLLGFIEPGATFYLLAEIGILLLLFEVGLETDVGQIIKGRGTILSRGRYRGYSPCRLRVLGSLSLVWSFYYTRTLYWRDDSGEQHWHNRTGPRGSKETKHKSIQDCARGGSPG